MIVLRHIKAKPRHALEWFVIFASCVFVVGMYALADLRAAGVIWLS